MELGFGVCAALSRRSSITNLNVVLAYRNINLEINFEGHGTLKMTFDWKHAH